MYTVPETQEGNTESSKSEKLLVRFNNKESEFNLPPRVKDYRESGIESSNGLSSFQVDEKKDEISTHEMRKVCLTDEQKLNKGDGKFKRGRKAVKIKKASGQGDIGADACWIQASQRGNKGKVAVIGRTKFNLVKIGKYKNKKRYQKTKLTDLPAGTIIALHCSNSKKGCCKNRKGRIKVPSNWSDEIPYLVKPEICGCDTLGLCGKFKPALSKEKAELRAKITNRALMQHSSKGVIRRERD